MFESLKNWLAGLRSQIEHAKRMGLDLGDPEHKKHDPDPEPEDEG